MCWDSHGLSVVVPTSKEDGSKLGGAGGAGLFEVLMNAAWMGVAGGLEAEGPVGPGAFGAVVSSPNWGKLASELCKLVLCLRISCTGWNPTMDEVCDLLRCILGVLSLVQELSILSGF